MPYISNTDKDRADMLAELGLNSIEELYKDIPSELRSKSLNIPEGKSEFEVRQYLKNLAAKNSSNLICFLGGGFYDHFIPAAVDAVISRSEFYTAYTPYQPEISQGVLQAMFEYQTAMCQLTDMDVSNCSLYDGGTALYEAAMMAVRTTKRSKVIVEEGVSLIYKTMLKCYTSNLDLEFVEVKLGKDGIADRNAIKNALDKNTACVILQNPNFLGCVDDITDICGMVHEIGGLVVLSTYPISLGMLKTPGEMGVDIATGDGQSLGLGLSFGGPYVGYITAKTQYIRQMPGRIVGETIDHDGKKGYVLTLQTREQHIRREKATSNICSNQALCALAAVTYLSLLGKEGLKEVAELCHSKANYTLKRLLEIEGVKLKYSNAFFNEFTIELPRSVGDVVGKLIEKGIAAGFPIGRYDQSMENNMLIAVTEKRTKEEIGLFAEALEAILKA